MAFLSGQGFDWPVLSAALPLGQHAWNVPAGLRGVAGSDTTGVWGEELIARADSAVYAAKNAGRNQVRTAVPRAA